MHPGYEYQGKADPTKMRKEELDCLQVKARIVELFNLADPSFHKLITIEHAFKLARPPPKVRNLYIVLQLCNVIWTTTINCVHSCYDPD